MDFEVPTDLINQSRIGFREGAGLSSFNPNDTTLPSLPTIEASISTLDPSSSCLRCKYCQGKLLRGLQSLICMYCGEYQKKDLHPDPISFNSTNGYSWLLQSLNLHGSERVVSLAEGGGIHGGPSPAEDASTLSELLDLQISWRDEPKKPDNTFNKAPELMSPLHLGTTNLDSFFTEQKEAIASASDISEEQQPVSSKNNFGDQENLTLFPNVLPPETSVNSSIDATFGWNAEFQFADTKVEDEIPKPVESFVGAAPDLSAHMDMFFGQMESPNNRKLNNDTKGKDWIQDDDLFTSMGPPTFHQAEQLKSVVKAKDEVNEDQDWFSNGDWQKSTPVKDGEQLKSVVVKAKDEVNEDQDWFSNGDWQKSTPVKDGDKFYFKPQIDTVSSPSMVTNDLVQEERSDFDNSNLKKQYSDTSNWFQDNQWTIGGSSTAATKDDAFDEWNDFTSSTGNQESFQDSWKQKNTENTPELRFPSSAEVDFGSFLFDGSSSNKNQNDGQEVFDIFSEVSTANRNTNIEAGNTTNPKKDVEMLMSQMHDLSFMLKTELSIPSKPDKGV